MLKYILNGFLAKKKIKLFIQILNIIYLRKN